ncbi:MAG: SpoIIE family protein phosphatase [Clostridium argentinense]|nr:SpoIIE family protein phosphatase [uncultured Clostridium sp.]MDU1348375.1 SpoIIE family protein phosphatase [Clostridium argentinense]
MKYFIDVAHFSMNKYGEELCGDNVEVAKTKNGMIVVMADGLGSGVKANILATLTSKIAVTMLREGGSIEDTIETITNILPECQIRKLAYSTFTIIQITDDGEIYMVEYDNPPVFFFRYGRACEIYKEEKKINGKRIYESRFYMGEHDVLTLVSDGAIHAGVGQLLNLGWQWEDINTFLESIVVKEKYVDNVARHLIEVCNNLYDNKPGDDTTVVTIKLKPKEYIDIFTGPPKDIEDDKYMVEKLLESKGKKVICGGTTANIVARELNKKIDIDLESFNKEVPPMAYMNGIDLVTEGLLTLNKTAEIIKEYIDEKKNKLITSSIDGVDGASKLSKMLIEEGTHIHIWVGQAINPAHQNPLFPSDFNLKIKVVKELEKYLKKLGKYVKITYI